MRQIAPMLSSLTSGQVDQKATVRAASAQPIRRCGGSGCSSRTSSCSPARMASSRYSYSSTSSGVAAEAIHATEHRRHNGNDLGKFATGVSQRSLTCAQAWGAHCVEHAPCGFVSAGCGERHHPMRQSKRGEAIANACLHFVCQLFPAVADIDAMPLQAKPHGGRIRHVFRRSGTAWVSREDGLRNCSSYSARALSIAPRSRWNIAACHHR